MVNSFTLSQFASVQFISESVRPNLNPLTPRFNTEQTIPIIVCGTLPNPAPISFGKSGFKAAKCILRLWSFHALTIPPTTPKSKYIGKYLMQAVIANRGNS